MGKQRRVIGIIALAARVSGLSHAACGPRVRVSVWMPCSSTSAWTATLLQSTHLDRLGSQSRSKSPAPAAVASDLAWFWEAVSPEITATGPGRLAGAVRELGNAPAGKGVPEPSLGTLARIANDHGVDILATTVGTKVSPALVLAVISVESAGRADAVSSAGAEGLMQLMPATAERFGVTDSLDPADNIKGGVAYLDWLMEEFGGDPILFLAAYNAGEGAVRSNGGVPPYRETRDYVPKVIAAWTLARALCVTPPELMTDGCVFQFDR